MVLVVVKNDFFAGGVCSGWLAYKTAPIAGWLAYKTGLTDNSEKEYHKYHIYHEPLPALISAWYLRKHKYHKYHSKYHRPRADDLGEKACGTCVVLLWYLKTAKYHRSGLEIP